MTKRSVEDREGKRWTCGSPEASLIRTKERTYREVERRDLWKTEVRPREGTGSVGNVPTAAVRHARDRRTTSRGSREPKPVSERSGRDRERRRTPTARRPGHTRPQSLFGTGYLKKVESRYPLLRTQGNVRFNDIQRKIFHEATFKRREFDGYLNIKSLRSWRDFVFERYRPSFRSGLIGPSTLPSMNCLTTGSAVVFNSSGVPANRTTP